MRTEPPHPLIRFRGVLLAVALLALAIGSALLLAWKYDPPMPTYAKVAFAATAITFMWLNGAFWWFELWYPHIEAATGTYVSRIEQGSKWGHIYFGFFSAAYGIGAIDGTVTVLRLTTGG